MKFRVLSASLTVTLALAGLVGISPLFAAEEDAENNTDRGTISRKPAAKIPTYVQKRIFKKTWKEKDVDFQIRSAAIGDLDGDGLNEVVSTNGKTLSLVQWDHGQFRTPASFGTEEKKRSFPFLPWIKRQSRNPLEDINKANRGLHNITLACADLDGDGRDEVLYRGMKKGHMISGILQYEGNSFSSHPADSGLYLELFHDKNGVPLLAGQDLGSGNENASLYQWDGKVLVKTSSLDLPDDTKLFSARSHFSGDAVKSSYVALNDDSILNFYSSDLKTIATVDSLSPPDLRTIRVRANEKDGGTGKKRYQIPKRLLTGDYDSDGRDEVLLILERPVINTFGLRSILVYNTVANIVLTNGSVREYWNTKPVLGEILDQSVGDIDNNGKDELVLFTKKGIIPFKKGTHILIYELSWRKR
jgi:hypothetical protein